MLVLISSFLVNMGLFIQPLIEHHRGSFTMLLYAHCADNHVQLCVGACVGFSQLELLER